MPEKLVEESEPSMQFYWERTVAIRESKDMRGSDPVSAVAKIAKTVLDSAVHTCTTADRELLRKIHKDMKLRNKGQDKKHPIPIAKWEDTVLSDRTSQLLSAEAARIEVEVTSVAKLVGGKMAKLTSGDEIKNHYFDFFVALADTMVGTDQLALFGKRCSASFPSASGNMDQDALVSRLRDFLESPVPEDFERRSPKQFAARNRKTGYSITRQKVSELFFVPHSRL